MHIGNIDTLEILSPYTETIYEQQFIIMCWTCYTEGFIKYDSVKSENCITYFWSSGDLLPNLSQTLN